mgnify:CR=1 FL=1
MPTDTRHPARCFLSFDYGKQRIGVASGQEITGTASPVCTLNIKQGKIDWQAIEKLLEQWQPDALVIGVPYHMDGAQCNMTLAAQRFGRQLHGRFNCPVHEMDERLSSIEAEQYQLDKRQAGGKRTTKGQTDSIAAAIILENWMTHHKDIDHE